ncbi:hypothetical protein ACFYP4_02600 [Streptomyces sp. NPDC005551]|uniref:hypothetical protein n=1 Tax=Streptomyces sp. NPDC005551 TaxID=3364725 RepID=UPI00368CC93C
MSGSLTSRATRAALDYLAGKRLDLGVAPQTMQLALLTAAPPVDPTVGQLNEVASTGYARQNVAWGLATNTVPGQPSQIANSSSILFGPFTDVNGLAYPATHCALVGVGVPDSTANLLSADVSEIETDSSGWNAANANTTKARSTTAFKQGAASLRVTSGAAGNMLVGTAVNPAVTAYTTYASTAWVYTTSSGIKTKIDLNFMDSTGVTTAYKTVGQTTLTPSTWTQLTHTTQAPAGSTQVQMLLSTDATAAGQIAYFDVMTLAPTLTMDVLMSWQFDVAGQAAQNESLQVSPGSLTMTLG